MNKDIIDCRPTPAEDDVALLLTREQAILIRDLFAWGVGAAARGYASNSIYNSIVSVLPIPRDSDGYLVRPNDMSGVVHFN